MVSPVDPAASASSVEEILITEQLAHREAASADASANRAFIQLAETMANEPRRLPQTLCDLALELSDAGSSGISMIRTRPDGEEYFYWEALSGIFAKYAGGTTARHFSPCGTSVDLRSTQLFSYPARFFPYLGEVPPTIVEVLVVPFFAASKPLGSIWIISHDEKRFTAEHARVMEGLGKFCGAAFNLLNLQRSAELLTQANSAKDEFIGLVSHELRGPVTTIYGFARLLRARAESLDAETLRKALGDIELESWRLERIIRDLLVLARPEQGEVDTEPIAVAHFLGRLAAEHRRQFPARSLEIDEPGADLLATANEDCLEQVVHNLLTNAEKYSPADSVIRLGARRDEAGIVFWIEDEGPGVPESEVELIFQPFYRSATTSSKASGIGIGLAVCMRLLQAQGGRIWVENSKNKGAVFSFTVPAGSTDVPL